MSALKRMYNVITGILMLLFAMLLFIPNEYGLYIVMFCIIVSLLLYGTKQIVFYFTMARYMVGGRNIFYRGVLILDVALFLLLIMDDPTIYIASYLIGGLALSGAISVLRGIESKKLQVSSWKQKIVSGVVKIMIAGASIFYVNSTRALIYIFAVGIIVSAISRISEALRKSAIIYVQ